MKTDDILEIARKRMQEARDVEDIHIERGESDLKFATGEGQWPEEERRIREAEGKPTLTFNAMPQYVRKVTGQIRQLNPAIKVSPSDDKATKEVAEIHEGLIREIEYRCDAPSVYEGAAESAAQCGIGSFRIRSEYCDHVTFDQHIVIERIFNPFAVFYDPRAKDPTRKDAEYAFVIDEMAKEAFKEQYPDAALVDFTSDHKPEWYKYWTSADNIAVAEYYWKDFDEYEIGITPMGQVLQGPFPKGMEISRKRTVRKPKVMWAKMTGAEILEGPTRVPGEHIPVIAVTGEEIHIGEQVYRSGVIRFAKDAQITYNVMRTTSIEVTMLQPRAPYLVTPKQVAGLETYWAQANNANRPYLPYNPDPNAPMPSRVPPPVASQALVGEAQMAAEDMKRTIGIYDASLGARSNETSGVAIANRQREAEISTSVYSDNMVKAVAHCGRVICGMIPEIYDAQRIVRILGEDAQEKIVTINEVVQTQYGEMVNNDMKPGKYAVRVNVGPTYTSRKQEAAAGMFDFMAKMPATAPLIADLVAGSQEWPDAERIAERLKKTVPPQLLDQDEQGENGQPMQPPQPSPQEQMAMQAEQQAMQQRAMMGEAEVRKAVAEAAEATADAKKAQAEAQKAQLEYQMMAAQMRLPMNAAQPAPMPGFPAQPGQQPF
jgi:hypothetical protein